MGKDDSNSVDILAIGAHPDDIELSCSGTLLKHRALGKSFAMLDLSMGQLGSRGTSETRLREAANAAKFLGAKYRHNLRWEDGFFEEDKAHLLGLIQEIRYARPKIILANSIRDRHPDHGRAASIIRRAVFLSGLVKIETHFEGVPQEAYRPAHLFHYVQDRYVQPDLIVDITEYFQSKLSAISYYQSQFYNPDSTEPETPISSRDFWDYIEAKDRYYGRMIHKKYGEGFVTERTVGVRDLTLLV